MQYLEGTTGRAALGRETVFVKTKKDKDEKEFYEEKSKSSSETRV